MTTIKVSAIRFGPWFRYLRAWQRGALGTWTVIRIMFAAMLISTASIKVTQSAVILTSGGIFASQAAISLVVAFELFAAVVIAGAPGKIARRFALLVFSGFAVVSAWALWAEQDCGCFGARTPKGISLLVDVIAVGLAVWALRAESNSKDGRKQRSLTLRSSVVLGLTVAVIAGGLAAWRIERHQAGLQMPTWFGENLIGTRSSLLSDSRFARHIPESGNVLLILLRPDCSHCREFAKEWGQQEGHAPRLESVIGVSISPNEWTVMPDIVSADAVSTPNGFVVNWTNNEPFVSSPALLAVHDGIVHSVGGEEEARALIDGSISIDSLFSEPSNRKGDTAD